MRVGSQMYDDMHELNGQQRLLKLSMDYSEHRVCFHKKQDHPFLMIRTLHRSTHAKNEDWIYDPRSVNL